jgi:hypothetical protein
MLYLRVRRGFNRNNRQNVIHEWFCKKKMSDGQVGKWPRVKIAVGMLVKNANK